MIRNSIRPPLGTMNFADLLGTCGAEKNRNKGKETINFRLKCKCCKLIITDPSFGIHFVNQRKLLLFQSTVLEVFLSGCFEPTNCRRVGSMCVTPTLLLSHNFMRSQAWKSADIAVSFIYSYFIATKMFPITSEVQNITERYKKYLEFCLIQMQ